MGAETKIEWVDHSWSPWHGCSEVHAGCDHCYAREMSKRNPKTLGTWGPDGTRVLASDASWDAVRRWNRACASSGVRQSVFPSICDPFEDFSGKVLRYGMPAITCRSCGGICYLSRADLIERLRDGRMLIVSRGMLTRVAELLREGVALG